SSMQQEIGLGDADVIERIIVRWPGSGTVQQFESVAMNRVWLVLENEPKLQEIDLPVIDLGGNE
ncbi:MAG: ASPIC/UnbV domain-containing protein, partial [Acidobacteria bacterium]|nr:ASPIC/UnbV domain-containing protein [Acidobacteriota bacterium]